MGTHRRNKTSQRESKTSCFCTPGRALFHIAETIFPTALTYAHRSQLPAVALQQSVRGQPWSGWWGGGCLPPGIPPHSISWGRNSNCPGLSCCSFLRPCCSAQPPTNTQTNPSSLSNSYLLEQQPDISCKTYYARSFPKEVKLLLWKNVRSTWGECHAAKRQYSTASQACDAPAGKVKS